MKRGLATFLVILPIMCLALLIVALHLSVDKERLHAENEGLLHLRQVEIDNSIRKSLLEVLKFASKQPLPCDEKITFAASKISGVDGLVLNTWQSGVTDIYAKQGVDVKFYIFEEGYFGAQLQKVPLTMTITLPDAPGKSIGGATAILTCNSVTGEVTNGQNFNLLQFMPLKPDGILYTVNDSVVGAYWESKITPNLYLQKSE